MNKSLITSIVLIVAVAFGIGWCSRNPSIEQWRAKYNLYSDSVSLVIRQATVSKKSMDSLRAAATQDSVLAAQYHQQAAQLNLALDTLHAANDSLRKKINASNSLAACDSLEICNDMHHAVVGLGAEVDSLRKQNTQLNNSYQSQIAATGKVQGELDISNARADRAETQLRNLPGAPPKEKLLFIPLPSRTASFFLGAGVVTVGTLVLSHVHVK